MEVDIGSMIEQYASVETPQYTNEEYAQLKRNEKAMCAQLRSLALDHAFSDRGAMAQYLDMQAKLRNLSPGNTLLVLSQNPNASDLRTLDAWNAVKRSVKKDERGLLILEPKQFQVEDDTGRHDVSGTSVTRRFDVSQTHGLPLMPVATVPFDPVQRFRSLLMKSPARFALSEQDTGVAAYYDAQERVIFCTEGYMLEDTLCSTATAIAEAMVKPDARNAGTPFAAECAAYIACRRIGMENMEGFRLDAASVPREIRLDTLGDAVAMANRLKYRLDRQPEQNQTHAQGKGR